MRRIFYGIVLLGVIAYILCGCGVPNMENGSAAESADVPEPAPAEASVLEFDRPPDCRQEPDPAPSYSPESGPSSAGTEPTTAELSVSPVYMVEYSELLSAVIKLPGTEGYEKYLTEDLCFHDAYRDPEDGHEYWTFDICLPQFGDNMPCYKELNSWFEELYARLLSGKDDRFNEISRDDGMHCFEKYSYTGMTVGERYLTVFVIDIGEFGGIRAYHDPMPVTFDLSTGQRVTLPEILNCSEEEGKELVADYVFDYYNSRGDVCARKDKYLCYEPEQFYMLEQGLGVYYPRYSIEAGAAGDFLYVIPYIELKEKLPVAALPEPQDSSTVTEIEYGEPGTVIRRLPGSEDYEAYLSEDVVYHDAYRTDENGLEQGTFEIRLPQFRGDIPYHDLLNAYFEDWYTQELETKEGYYQELKSQEKEDQLSGCHETLSYRGMFIGERYLTVYTDRVEYDGESGDAVTPMPVTFDLSTGQRVTLPEILNRSEREVQEWVADHIYRYLFNKSRECSWLECCLCYEPEQFYMLEQGLGVYYSWPALSSTGEGDSLFIIPYEALAEEMSGNAGA